MIAYLIGCLFSFILLIIIAILYRKEDAPPRKYIFLFLFIVSLSFIGIAWTLFCFWEDIAKKFSKFSNWWNKPLY